MPFLTVDTPLPAIPVAPIIPSHIDVIGRQAVYDTTNLDNSGVEKKIEVADYQQTTIGANHFGFRWPRYTYTISYSNDKPGQRSEHVADTVRVDKHGTATSFGRVTEMNDFSGKGANVGHEVDIRLMPTVSNADALDNGLRFAFDAVIAGSNDVADTPREVGATAFVRTGGANPLAYWSYGAIFGAIKEAGVRIVSRFSGAVRGVELIGKYIVGLDLSQAECQSAIRLAPGQRMTFEPTDQISWSWLDGRLRVQNGNTNILEIDTTTGDIYKHGAKVL